MSNLSRQSMACAGKLRRDVFNDPDNSVSRCHRPLRKVIPRSSSKPRVWLITAVCRISQRSRTDAATVDPTDDRF
jgi:hypothetical protein